MKVVTGIYNMLKLVQKMALHVIHLIRKIIIDTVAILMIAMRNGL
jgi:hypothetical protein